MKINKKKKKKLTKFLKFARNRVCVCLVEKISFFAIITKILGFLVQFRYFYSFLIVFCKYNRNVMASFLKSFKFFNTVRIRSEYRRENDYSRAGFSSRRCKRREVTNEKA